MAFLILLAITNYSIEAGDSKPLKQLQTNTQTFTANLREEANNKTNKLITSLVNTIKWIESDRRAESLKTGIIKGNYKARGKSGEIGAYQIMPGTWNRYCNKYFKKVLEPTEENQDLLVSYVIEDLINRDYSIEEIAAIWNSGSHRNWQTKIGINSKGAYYNVPAYVATFKSVHKKLKIVNTIA